ncbi:DUF4143 domain-containing protein [bacterium]|nr:DUF4143 domain-containing protein [bacterium]
MILENMNVIFKISPYHKNVARAIQKAPKYYFFDTGQVIGDSGIKLENTVACALQKEIHFREDCYGETRTLCYLKNKEGREIDFLVTSESGPGIMIEVKWKDETLSSNFQLFRKFFPQVRMIQVVKKLKREKTFPSGVEIRKAHGWLSRFILP